ncbi:MAG: UDP-N-acetylmuramate--L-alanine ligase [Flavobacteriaceae bacterium]|nr:UDP-N-acetylmuramate--L-alanine ligase [Flavobacteriaceae bacterium]|tara:strand:+ start:4305 stop:5645 length:1341 start_codon:yes stop_codon:yes gene_type:complete
MIEKYNKIYFIGIGGIGMSSIALYFLDLGKTVGGYDKTRTDLTINLENQGAKIHYNLKISKIPSVFKNKQDTLIIYTPAISKDNIELDFFIKKSYNYLKRSEALGLISQNKFCIAIAGTHGKTTTSIILSHLLYENNISFTSFVGGISENYNSNYIEKGQDIILVEADEFDRSFLTLKPNIACITSIDLDHLDIYNSRKDLQNSFNEFARNLEKDGMLFKNFDLEIDGISYGFDSNAEYSIVNYKTVNDSAFFDIIYKNGKCENIRFEMPGKHNASNALAAFAICKELKINDGNLKKSLATFKGVKRRFSYVLKSPKILIDDYAHHPKEIQAIKDSIFSLYPEKIIMAIFQPHLFSRTRDFMNEFASTLSMFHEIVLLDIYPAREEPIENINSNELLNKIDNNNKKLIKKIELENHIINSKADVIVVMGAGDISNEVENIKNAILI